MERRILKSKKFYILNELIKFSFLGIIMTVFGFIFTWTPYAMTFFISAFSRCDANFHQWQYSFVLVFQKHPLYGFQ